MASFVDAMYSPRAQKAQQAIALVAIAGSVAALKINVGLPPTVIVGASAMCLGAAASLRSEELRQPLSRHS